MKFELLASLSVVASLYSSGAMALPQCTGRFAQIYNDAKSDRIRELRRAWAARNYDCSFQVEFEAVFGFFDESGPAVRSCKNQGTNEGTLQVLQEIGKQCRQEGKNLGGIDGSAYAVEYCSDLTTAYSTVAGDFDIAYSTQCKDSFTRRVRADCPEKITDEQDFLRTVESKCRI